MFNLISNTFFHLSHANANYNLFQFQLIFSNFINTSKVMTPGLVVLPLEVWTDVFVFPWITRRKLAQIVDKIGDRKFAEKLQFRLHDMGKHSLRYLEMLPNNSYVRFSIYKN